MIPDAVAHTLKRLPETSGCYLMKNGAGEIIYIGKAKNLAKRVSSYFQNTDHDPKTTALVAEIASIDFILTDNEVEALLLESRLVRTHKPHYNIDLKNSIKYAYLKITDEEFPRLITTRQHEGDGKYFGPFPRGRARAIAERVASRIFKLRVCTTLPKRACILYHLGQCTAPCIKKVTKEEYARQVRKAEMFLTGRSDELIVELEAQMQRESRRMMYEQAAETKEQIRELQHLTQKQNVDLPKAYDQHVINFLTAGDKVYFQLFPVKKGVVSGRQEYHFEAGEETVEQFIKQYYSVYAPPEEIIVPQRLVDHELIEEFLSKMRQRKVVITVPSRGYKRDLLELARKNISMKLESAPAVELQAALNLSMTPREIDCFDISNISGTSATGSCVRLSDGVPNKKLYRRFRIKRVIGPNDFAMMSEVVDRRYRKAASGELPDLILIDGGLGQLHAAFEALRKIGHPIPIVSLAKRLEEIYTLESSVPIRLPEHSAALRLVQRARDEAHRFAVKYHTHLRSRKMIE